MTDGLPFELRNVGIRFGGIHALEDVTFGVEAEKIVGLIGPNGAGKTTVLNCICGFYRPGGGQIRFGETDLRRTRPHQLVKLGIRRTFQYIELFPSMTVLDNLMLAQHSVVRAGLVSLALRLPWAVREERRMRLRAREVLRFLDLNEYEEWPVGALAYGVRKRLDMGRAIVLPPRLLLMDEPASGLTAKELGSLGELIRKIRRDYRAAVLLVEHHMPLVMDVCDRVVVLNFGRKLAEGTPAEVQSHPDVLAAYLGRRSGGLA